MKKTKTRELVLNVFKNSDSPINANDLFELLKVENITLSSIYRTLATFVENKIIKKEITPEGVAIYSLIKNKHNHLLECKDCHTQIKLKYCPYHEINKEIENTTDFCVDEHNMIIYGTCKDCKNKKNNR